MKTLSRYCRIAVVLTTTALLGACASTSGPKEDPYALFRQFMPESILVLPAVNESVDVGASYSWLTTATQPIAEQGFYVFPVAVVDEFMKENGLPNPEDMHAAPLNKFGEIFGADAVMYVTIEEFGQKFELVQSVTKVWARAELVHVETGQLLWRDRVQFSEANSSSSGGGLVGLLVNAAVAQVGNSLTDAAHDASRIANVRLFQTRGKGLLFGPDHPGFDQQMADAQAKAAELEAQIVPDAPQ